MTDLIAVDASAIERLTDDGGSQIAGGHILERAAKIPYGAARAGDDQHFLHDVPPGLNVSEDHHTRGLATGGGGAQTISHAHVGFGHVVQHDSDILTTDAQALAGGLIQGRDECAL
ncbi:Uncharacterised protein [Bordetella holmesii]|nr:Uncharacterised protein [Bordetella holmesii]